MEQRSPVAIVTGAGRGLGETYARALSAAGFAVVVNDLDDDVAQAAVDTIVSAGGQAIAVAGSVDSEETAQALVQQDGAGIERCAANEASMLFEGNL